MDRIIDIAAYLVNQYEKSTEKQITEKKLHNLLYITQRETLALLNQAAFNEPFEGWANGPVSLEIRSWFRSGKSSSRAKEPTDKIKAIINGIILAYGSLSERKLSNLEPIPK